MDECHCRAVSRMSCPEIQTPFECPELGPLLGLALSLQEPQVTGSGCEGDMDHHRVWIMKGHHGMAWGS